MEVRDDRAHIRLDLDRGQGTIRGQLWIDDGASERFEGWLQLTNLLEQARAHDGRTPDGARRSGQPDQM